MAAAANGPLPPLTYPNAGLRKPSLNRLPVTISPERCRRPRRIVRSLSQMPGREPRCPEIDPARDEEEASVNSGNRREFLLKPLLAIGGAWLASGPALAAAAGDASPAGSSSSPAAGAASVAATPKKEDIIVSRVYDATVIGEPLALGKDKSRIWEKLLNARVVYLGEAEHVPVRDDKDLELEIVRNLRNKCFDQSRSISLAVEAFPCNLQEQLNEYTSKRIDGESLRSFVSHWPPDRWLEYEPLLNYCRDNGVHLIACGTPLEVLRKVQAEGIRGLTSAERRTYAPPAGSGFVSGFSRRTSIDINSSSNLSVPFGPSSYLSAQSRVVEEYTMSQIVLQALQDGGSVGMLVVVTGASHVVHGSRGVGLPARISKKLQKKNQVVILLNPERQELRKEGEVPIADFLWYSAARPCSRNCFDRAEIARVMNAASRRRDALPQDLQRGLDLGLVSPEVLQNFFDLEQYPFIAELTKQFQGFRERLLADPKFLHRLAIEEAISITTTLLAQYERRKEHFFEEIDYVLTDTIRGSVVDFFTVWLPAPTLSFLPYDDSLVDSEKLSMLKGFLGSIPDNAFQTSIPGKDWNLNHRVASVLVGGAKLFGVGIISSIGAVASSNMLYALRRYLNPVAIGSKKQKRSPILKTALVYGCFLGTSANIRYQIIAGVVEHRISNEFLASDPILVNALSFVARTVNSYWGTQQWVDLARFTGLQTSRIKSLSSSAQEIPVHATVENEASSGNNVDGSNNQPSDSSTL